MDNLYIMTIIIVVFVLLPLCIADTNTICQGNIPHGCTCSEGDLSNDTVGAKLTCESVGFTSLPEDITPSYYIKITNNTIDVIAHIPYGPEVKFIHLQHNKIRLIQDGAFDNMSGLHTLDLAYNLLSDIQKLAFRGLTELTVLVLKGNPLHVLKLDTFDGVILPQLTNLDLDYCEIYRVEEAAVDSLPNLIILTMNNNHLDSVPILGCEGHALQNLMTIDISNNKIADVKPSNCHLPTLVHFNLNYNQIQTINANFYGPSLSNLQSLHLKHNHISSIHSDAFNGTHILSILDISFNELTDIDNATLPWKSLNSVKAHDNPWTCDCGNMWLVSQAAVADYNQIDELRCALPDKFYNRTVSSVQDEVFKLCVSHQHIVPIIIGVVACIIAVAICIVIMYFAFNKKRSINRNLRGSSASGLRTGSSIYRRMNSDSEVIFDQELVNNHSEYRPVWKEMTNYDDQRHGTDPFTI